MDCKRKITDMKTNIKWKSTPHQYTCHNKSVLKNICKVERNKPDFILKIIIIGKQP